MRQPWCNPLGDRHLRRGSHRNWLKLLKMTLYTHFQGEPLDPLLIRLEDQNPMEVVQFLIDLQRCPILYWGEIW